MRKSKATPYGRAITTAEFKRALSLIPPPTAGQKKFLQAHYDAPGRAATMSNLAEAAGYRSYGAVNLQYGRLAERIASALNRPLPFPNVFLLAEDVDPKTISGKQWVLIMRPAFAAALCAAGWVE